MPTRTLTDTWLDVHAAAAYAGVPFTVIAAALADHELPALTPDPDRPAGGDPRLHRVRGLVEKPSPDSAPSNLAIIGRYVLTPDIFPVLAATKSDRTGEIQLTNGLRELLKKRPIYACEVKGVRHDTGNKLGFLKAVVYFALRRPDLGDKFAAYLNTVVRR